jgi:hypothetical protein
MAMPPYTPPAMHAPTLRAVADGRWDAAATWGGRVPAAGDIVLVPRDRTVELAGATAALGGLWVDGTLSFADADIALTTRYAMVTGRLLAGSEQRPYARRAVITLTGSDTTHDVLGMGTKAIGVLPGGLLKLHGEHRLAWTQLAESAAAGATSLLLKDDAGSWRVGDRVVLATGGFDPRDSEVLTVTSVAGNRIGISPALRNARAALVQTIEGRTLDQRPSIGLLSRNITIRGDDASDAIAFGGHVMVMAGGQAQVSGIELTKMGQRGNAGRYPFHWHVVGDAPGQYLAGSSVHGSFQRAVVVHSTHNATVDGVVAYNIPNHAFVWAEDGDERNTTMTRNLGILVRSPAPEHFGFRINNPFFGNSAQGEQRSAVFWGRSFAGHVIRGNVSAGSLDGFGFFFDLFTPRPASVGSGADEGGGLVFDGNVAHATFKTLATGNQINYPEATTGHGLMITTGASGRHQHVFRNFTAYHNVSGVWLEDRAMRLADSVVADNGTGVLVLRGVIDNLLAVGDSAHPVTVPNMPASVTFGFGSAIQVAGSNHGGKRAPVILSATLVNQRGAGLIWDLDNMSPQSFVGSIRYVNTPQRAVVLTPHRFEFFPDSPIFGVNDATGAMAGDGRPVRVMMRDSPLADSRCTPHLDAQMWTCPPEASLLLSAPQSLTLVEDSGLTTYLRDFDYGDRSMPAQDAVSWVGHGRRYEVLGGARARQDFTLAEAQGKQIDLVLAAAGPASRVMQGGQPVPAAASLAALGASTTSAHAYDAASRRLVVRLVGGAGTQAVSIEAPLVASSGVGRAPVALPAGATAGIQFSVTAQTAAPALRHTPPVGATRSGRLAASTIDGATIGTLMSSVVAGDTTVLRGYVFAPADGLYRLGLFGSGGGTSLWVGDSFVHGDPSAFINSNWLRNGQLAGEFGVFQPNGVVALRAGWHPIAVVHAKRPDNRDSNALHLRWIPPGGGNSWQPLELRSAP